MFNLLKPLGPSWVPANQSPNRLPKPKIGLASGAQNWLVQSPKSGPKRAQNWLQSHKLPPNPNWLQSSKLAPKAQNCSFATRSPKLASRPQNWLQSPKFAPKAQIGPKTQNPKIGFWSPKLAPRPEGPSSKTGLWEA